MFPRYFRYAVAEGDISDAGMGLLLDLAKDYKVFGDTLVELANQKRPDGTTRARLFLERFEDYIDKIPKNNIPSIIQALCNMGDELLKPEDDLSILFGIPNVALIENIIIVLLYKYDDLDRSKIRYDILKRVISDGIALSIVVELVERLELQHKEKDTPQQHIAEEPLVSKDKVLSLKKIAVGKIWRSAEDKSLLRTPEFRYILLLWFDWDDKTKIKEWVRDITVEDQDLILFIERFSYKGRLDFKNLEQFIDLSQVISRIKDHKNKESITETQKVALQQLIQEFEKK